MLTSHDHTRATTARAAYKMPFRNVDNVDKKEGSALEPAGALLGVKANVAVHVMLQWLGLTSR